jgi:hypothetical protein
MQFAGIQAKLMHGIERTEFTRSLFRQYKLDIFNIQLNVVFSDLLNGSVDHGYLQHTDSRCSLQSYGMKIMTSTRFCRTQS